MKLDLDPQLKTVDSWIKLRILQHKKNSKFLKIFEKFKFLYFYFSPVYGVAVLFAGAAGLLGLPVRIPLRCQQHHHLTGVQRWPNTSSSYNISWITEVTNTERWKARKIGVKLFLQNTTLGSSENKYCIILTVNQWFESGSGWIRSVCWDRNPGRSKCRGGMRSGKKSFRIHNTALNNT